MESLPQNTGQHEGLQTKPPLLRQASGLITETEEARVGRCIVSCCPCRRGVEAQGDVRPQAGMAGIQPRWLRSGAEPPWQHSPAASSYQRVAGLCVSPSPGRLVLLCRASGQHHSQLPPTGRASWDAEVRKPDPAWPFPKRKPQRWCLVGSAEWVRVCSGCSLALLPSRRRLNEP